MRRVILDLNTRILYEHLKPSFIVRQFRIGWCFRILRRRLTAAGIKTASIISELYEVARKLIAHPSIGKARRIVIVKGIRIGGSIRLLDYHYEPIQSLEHSYGVKIHYMKTRKGHLPVVLAWTDEKIEVETYVTSMENMKDRIAIHFRYRDYEVSAVIGKQGVDDLEVTLNGEAFTVDPALSDQLCTLACEAVYLRGFCFDDDYAITGHSRGDF